MQWVQYKIQKTFNWKYSLFTSFLHFFFVIRLVRLVQFVRFILQLNDGASLVLLFFLLSLYFSITLNSRRSRNKKIDLFADWWEYLCVPSIWYCGFDCIGLSKWLLAETSNMVKQKNWKEKIRIHTWIKPHLNAYNHHTIVNTHTHTHAITIQSSNVHCREAWHNHSTYNTNTWTNSGKTKTNTPYMEEDGSYGGTETKLHAHVITLSIVPWIKWDGNRISTFFFG